MAKRDEKPFNKILSARSKLRMYVEYGDHAIVGQTPQEFAADVLECFEYLMEFRNIINGMVGFDEAPSRAVIPYLSDEALADCDAR
jgi:hypothetical protein